MRECCRPTLPATLPSPASCLQFGQCGVGSNEEVVVAPQQVQVRAAGGWC